VRPAGFAGGPTLQITQREYTGRGSPHPCRLAAIALERLKLDEIAGAIVVVTFAAFASAARQFPEILYRVRL
jgi:hypothetical protein